MFFYVGNMLPAFSGDWKAIHWYIAQARRTAKKNGNERGKKQHKKKGDYVNNDVVHTAHVVIRLQS